MCDKLRDETDVPKQHILASVDGPDLFLALYFLTLFAVWIALRDTPSEYTQFKKVLLLSNMCT